MWIELVPDPGSDDLAARAAALALEETGIGGEVDSAAIGSAWRREAIRDAVERAPAPQDGYASPRRILGAPRA